MANKRGIIIADTHCGHLLGLTPQPWQLKGDGWKKQVRDVQRQCWNWFDGEMSKLPNLDFILANGDLVDGKGEKSGGIEQLTTNTQEQAEMASYILKRLSCRKTKILMARGTPYHTGKDDDTEDLVAHDVGAAIGDQLWPEINGLVFDMKHKVGSSGIPHGRSSAIKRAALWNMIWAEANEQPKAKIFIRSHVHYADVNWSPDFGYGLVTPGLQGFGSRYGARQCEGRVHFGFYYIEVTDKGELIWVPKLAKIATHRSQTTEV